MGSVEMTTKYEVLIDYIKGRIADGSYQNGDKLESENQLVDKFGFSRQTVRQALGILENEGVLERRRGSGTYIRVPKPRHAKTFNIGIIATYISDYIFPYIINGIESELTPQGYHITIGVTKNKIEEESRVLRSFMDRHMDGIIIEGTKSAFPNPNLELYRKLQDMDIPVVFFNSYYPALENTIFVVTDDMKAGQDITRHLIDCGCNTIGGMFKSDDMQGHKRYSGYTKALMEAGLEFDDDRVIWYTTSDEARFGEEDFDRYIYRSFRECDAVVCYNDKVAARLLSVLGKYEVNVPEDIMIGSFDNSSLSEYSFVPITSMNHPKENLGRIAARKLLNLIDTHKHESSLVMDMELVQKKSTKKKNTERN